MTSQTLLLNQLIIHQAEMQQQGIRRLLILSGESAWSHDLSIAIQSRLPGHWLWLGHQAPAGFKQVARARARSLLGQEFQHAVFDAHQELDVEALAILAGTLTVGSWLLLLVPPWQTWEQSVDQDSLRWADTVKPIATTHFVRHLKRVIGEHQEAVVWRQALPWRIPALKERAAWCKVECSPTDEQRDILQQLLRVKVGIWLLIAARGRGKSALAGMLAKAWHGNGECWLTGPNQAATMTLQQYAAGRVRFWAPDELLAYCQQKSPNNVDWLFIDEAAAIPLPLLAQLVALFPRTLLTTTVQGYEGTGTGFLLKFRANLPQATLLHLIAPIRWAATDPLEQFINQLLFFQEDIPITESTLSWSMRKVNQTDLAASPNLLRQFYGLLRSAHYRTRPLDLRRLLDAPAMAYAVAITERQQVIGAVWRVAEGGLNRQLAHEIWTGRRRPKGNLVAQSLAAHSGQWQAPILRSSRISRIAVMDSYRRQGVAKALVTAEIAMAEQRGEDYLAVSFGFAPDLWAFWLACGFKLARIGHQREAGSGCYTAMALYPLTPKGQALYHSADKQLRRDSDWLPAVVKATLPWQQEIGAVELVLDVEDWRELAGFAFAHRTLQASRAALFRLLCNSQLPLVALRLYLQADFNLQQITDYCGLSGKTALLQRWREETQQALTDLDPSYCTMWRDWVDHGDQ